MSENVSLTPRQKRAVAALIQARTIAEAAEIASVSERQLFRWMHEPVFLLELRAAEGEAISEAVRSLIVDLRANHDFMRTTRDDPNEVSAIRLRAAMALDGSLLKWREFENVEERLNALESEVFGDQEPIAKNRRARANGIATAQR